jgi:hypothetical protein
MPYVVLALPVGRALVGSPFDRPRDHVMPRRIVNPTIRTFTQPRSVHIGQDAIRNRNETAGRERRTFCVELCVIGRGFFSQRAPRSHSRRSYQLACSRCRQYGFPLTSVARRHKVWTITFCEWITTRATRAHDRGDEESGMRPHVPRLPFSDLDRCPTAERSPDRKTIRVGV